MDKFYFFNKFLTNYIFARLEQSSENRFRWFKMSTNPEILDNGKVVFAESYRGIFQMDYTDSLKVLLETNSISDQWYEIAERYYNDFINVMTEQYIDSNVKIGIFGFTLILDDYRMRILSLYRYAVINLRGYLQISKPKKFQLKKDNG